LKGGGALKRKLIISVLLCAVIFASFAATAEDDIYFTAVNDKFLTLTESTMPQRINGTIYMPYTVFTGALNLKSAYTASEQVLVLYNFDYILTFNIPHGYSYDQKMTSFNQTAVITNGRVYVPAAFVCSRFGFTMSSYTCSQGNIIRIKNSSSYLSDSMLASIGSSLMDQMLADYYKEEDPDQPPAPVEDDPPEQVRSSIYITFDGDIGSGVGDILDLLARYNYKATFFLSGETITNNGDAIRTMIAKGHCIGINGYVDDFYASAAAAVKSTDAANAALDKITCMKTRIVRAPQCEKKLLNENMRDALISSGYRIWDFTAGYRDVSPDATAYSLSSSIISALSKNQRAPAVIMLDTSARSAEAFSRILSYLSRNNYYVQPITELTVPINFYEDRR